MTSIGQVSFDLTARNTAGAAVQQVEQQLKQMGQSAQASRLTLDQFAATLGNVTKQSSGLSTTAKQAQDLRDALLGVGSTTAQLADVGAAMQSLAGEMTQLNATAQRMSDSLVAANGKLSALGGGLRDAGGSAEKTGGLFAGLVKNLGTAALWTAVYQAVGLFEKGLGDAGAAIIGFNAQLETAQVAFTHMDGSVQAAQAELEQLRDFAARTPFDFPGLLQAAQELQGAGVAAKDVIPLMTDIGNAAAYAGRVTPEEIQRITTAITQIRNSVHLNAQDMNQLIQAGIPAWKILADAMGVTQAQARALADQGQISGQVFIDAFDRFSKLNFGGLMQEESHTFTASVSNIQDGLRNLLATGFRPLFDEISQLAYQLATFLTSDQAKVWAQNIASAVGQVLSDLNDLFSAVGQVRDALSGLFGTGAAAGAQQLSAAYQTATDSANALTAAQNAALTGGGAQAQAVQQIQQYNQQAAAATAQAGEMAKAIAANNLDAKELALREADVKASFEGQIQPLQANLDAMKAQNQEAQRQVDIQEGQVKAAYEGQLRPLQDIITAEQDRVQATQAVVDIEQNQIQRAYESQIQPLQDALDHEQLRISLAQQYAQIQETQIKESYQGQIDPLQRELDVQNMLLDNSQHLAQINEDEIKASYDAQIQPLQRQLDIQDQQIAVAEQQAQIQQRQIQQSYEGQISALQRQLDVMKEQVSNADELASIADKQAQAQLQQAQLAAVGDPEQRAKIAAALEANKLQEDAITNAQKQADLAQQIAQAPAGSDQARLLQLQLDDLKQQAALADLANNAQLVRIAHDQIIVDAQTQQRDLATQQRDILAQIAEMPLEQNVKNLQRAEQDALKPVQDQLNALQAWKDRLDPIANQIKSLQLDEQGALQPWQDLATQVGLARDATFDLSQHIALLKLQEQDALKPWEDQLQVLQGQNDALFGQEAALKELQQAEKDALEPVTARKQALQDILLQYGPMQARIKALQDQENLALRPLEARKQALQNEADSWAPIEAKIKSLQDQERAALAPLQQQALDIQTVGAALQGNEQFWQNQADLANQAAAAAKEAADAVQQEAEADAKLNAQLAGSTPGVPLSAVSPQQGQQLPPPPAGGPSLPGPAQLFDVGGIGDQVRAVADLIRGEAQAVQAVNDKIKDFFGLADKNTPVLSGLATAARGIADALQASGVNAQQFSLKTALFSNPLGQALELLVELDKVKNAIPALGPVWEQAQKLAGTFFSNLGAAAQNTNKLVGKQFSELGTTISGWASNRQNDLTSVHSAIVNLQGAADAKFAAIKATLGSDASDFGTWVQGRVSDLGTVGGKVGAFVQGAGGDLGNLGKALGQAAGAAATNFGTIGNSAGSAKDAIGAALSALITNLQDTFKPDGAVAKALQDFTKQGGTLDTWKSDIVTAVQGIVAAIEQQFASMTINLPVVGGLVQRVTGQTPAGAGNPQSNTFAGLPTGIRQAFTQAGAKEGLSGQAEWAKQYTQQHGAPPPSGSGAGGKPATGPQTLGALSANYAALAGAAANIGDNSTWRLPSDPSVTLCEAFTEQMEGWPRRFATAIEAANYFGARGKLNGGNPPAGAAVYFAAAQSNLFDGHTGIADGQGGFISMTDQGVMDFPIGMWPTWNPGATYLGWVQQAQNAFANGGYILEPVLGVGLRSGQSYAFGERGPEQVIPSGRSAGRGGSTFNVTMHSPAVAMTPTELERTLARLELLYGGSN